jgi:hypothetical protein
MKMKLGSNQKATYSYIGREPMLNVGINADRDKIKGNFFSSFSAR